MTTKIISLMENWLTRTGERVLFRPGLTIGLCIAASVLFALGMSRLYVDVSNESLLRNDDPTLKQYHAFQRQFGRDDSVIAAIDSPKIFTSAFFQKLDAFQKDLEAEVPYLDLATSLVSVTSISNKNGDVLIDDLKQIWPKKTSDFDQFKSFVVQNPLYKRLIISEDGNTTVLIIRANAYASQKEDNRSLKERVISLHDRLMDFMAGNSKSKHAQESEQKSSTVTGELDLDILPTEEIKTNPKFSGAKEDNTVLKPLSTSQLSQFITAVKKVSGKYSTEDFNIRLAGGQMIDAEHKDSIHLDLAKLLPIAFVGVFIVLYLALRRISGVLLPMLVVILSLLSTMGVMGWIGSPITPVAVALPSLILTIGVGDAVHLLGYYYGHLSKTGEHNTSILYAIKRTGVPIVFTTLTTAAGFMAFIISDIKSISDFGLMAAFGVLVALVLTMTLIPAVLCKMSLEHDNMVFQNRWHGYARMMSKISNYSLNHDVKILLVFTVILCAAIPGVSRLKFSHDVLSWFPEDRPIRVNTLAVDKKFRGSIPLEVVVDTGKKNGIYDPDFMRRLDAFEEYTQNMSVKNIEMGRTTSIVDTLKEIHRVVTGSENKDALPGNRDLVAQELLLFEGSGASDVEKLIDSNFSKVRVTVRMSWADAVDYVPARNEIERKAKEMFSDMATITVTGSIDLVSRSLVGVMRSMSSSYLIAAIVITAMLIILTRSAVYGLVGMIPNFLPIVVTLGIMGYAGYPINMFTVLLGGIALGLAVDDTVHFMHGYRFQKDDLGQPVETSVLNTVDTAGPALLFTTVAITLGFILFTFSTMDSLFYFGLFLGLTLVNALAADIVLVPALLKMVDRIKFKQSAVKEVRIANTE